MKYIDFMSVGQYRADIMRQTDALFQQLKFYYSIFDQQNRLSLSLHADEEHMEKASKGLYEIIISTVKAVNVSVDSYNRASESAFGLTIRKVSSKGIKGNLERLFKPFSTDAAGYELVAPYKEEEFFKYVNQLLEPTMMDLADNLRQHRLFKESFNLDGLPKEYRKDLDQMFDIYMLGYKSTALLVLGRVIEKLLLSWSIELIDSNQLDKTKEEMRNIQLENTLGIFKSKNFITEKEWHTLSKLRLDRNIGGHYLSENDALHRKESEQESEMTIKLTIDVLKRLLRRASNPVA